MQKHIAQQTLTLYLSGELDMSNADDLKTLIDRDIDRKRIRTVILDLSAVTFIDSSALGVILGRYKKLLALGGKIQITNTPPHIYRILSISGLPGIIEFTSDGKEIS
ncbi:MAG: anti-sigma factor antagonist [Gracilibacteraceae bacterium]|nr:anti-sigma factor antagonist [Gracilibacteraceae bacterium]